MNSLWQLFSNALSKDECDFIISHCLEYRPQDATVGHGSDSQKNESIRRTKVRWLSRIDPKLEFLFKRILMNGKISNNNAFGFDLDDFHEVQMLEYPSHIQGHYEWHEDLCWKPDPAKATPFQRKLSMVIQLSDPATYTGGKLELDRDPIPAGQFCNPGDMIFFPSFLRHKANAVTKGVRYCLTAWFNGPNFR